MGNFLKTHLNLFCGRTAEADSVLMPQVRAWVRDQAQELGSAPDDHQVVVYLCCPSLGIMGAQYRAFMLSFISNILADHPVNSVAIIVHPNRASQESRTGRVKRRLYATMSDGLEP